MTVEGIGLNAEVIDRLGDPLGDTGDTPLSAEEEVGPRAEKSVQGN